MRSTRRLFAALLGIALVAGCSAATNPGADPSSVTGTPASIAPVSSLAASEAPIPTMPAAVVTPAPTPAFDTAQVAITQRFFRYWRNAIGSIEFQIVIEATNSGGGFANLEAPDQSFTVFGKDGKVLSTNAFAHVFPQVIGPGETAYYVANGTFDDGTKMANIGKLDLSLTYAEAPGARDAYEVSKVTVSQEPSGADLQVTGIVKNATTANAAWGIVGIILFDGSGKILGALYDSSGITAIRAGQSMGFTTSEPGMPPLSPSQVKAYLAFAFDSVSF